LGRKVMTEEVSTKAMALKAQGVRNKDIAAQLGIQYKTLTSSQDETKRFKQKSKAGRVEKQLSDIQCGDFVTVITMGEPIEGMGRKNQKHARSGTIIYKDDTKIVVQVKPWERVTVTYNDLMSRYVQIRGSK
jgi:hypothetical protein